MPVSRRTVLLAVPDLALSAKARADDASVRLTVGPFQPTAGDTGSVYEWAFNILPVESAARARAGWIAARPGRPCRLAQRSRVLLADEPVASLERTDADAILTLLKSLGEQAQLAILISLHQPDLGFCFADRRLHLSRAASRPPSPAHGSPRSQRC